MTTPIEPPFVPTENVTKLLGLPLFGDMDKPTWRGHVNYTNNTVDSAHGDLLAKIQNALLAAENYTDDSVAKALSDANTHTDTSISKRSANVDVSEYIKLTDSEHTAGINKAIADAIKLGKALYFPSGVNYVTDGHTITNANNLRVIVEGRIARRNNATRRPIFNFVGCENLTIERIATDGNAFNNLSPLDWNKGDPCDEGKHCVQLKGCTNVSIGEIDSRNPSGDTLYIDAKSKGIYVQNVISLAPSPCGRNAVSLIDCSNVYIGRVYSRWVGWHLSSPAMPGGLDIEPNENETVENVYVGVVDVATAATSGFNVLGGYDGPYTGKRQIKNVQVDSVMLEKYVGVVPTACDMVIRGVSGLHVNKIMHTTSKKNTNQAMAINNADRVYLDVDIRQDGRHLAIGYGQPVDDFYIKGTHMNSATQNIYIYGANRGTFDMTLRNCNNKEAAIVVDGTATDITLKGDMRKGETGIALLVVGGEISGWRMENLDTRGWGEDARIKGGGKGLDKIKKSNVLGLTNQAHRPYFDYWGIGDVVTNDAPEELARDDGTKYVVTGWICTTAGVPDPSKRTGRFAELHAEVTY